MAFLFALGMSIAMQFHSSQRSCEAVTAFEVSSRLEVRMELEKAHFYSRKLLLKPLHAN